MSGQKDDVFVWNSFLSGDDRAYELIYNQHIRKLLLYGKTLTSDEELVKDCIHDVFIHIYRNRKNLGKTDNIRLYLISSLKNAILMAFRKKNAYDKFKNSYQEEEIDHNTAIDQIIDREEEAENNTRMDSIWSVLTDRQKEIIYYRYVEGLSLTEISEKENIHYHSVANIIQRAVKKMKDFYNKSD